MEFFLKFEEASNETVEELDFPTVGTLELEVVGLWGLWVLGVFCLRDSWILRYYNFRILRCLDSCVLSFLDFWSLWILGALEFPPLGF